MSGLGQAGKARAMGTDGDGPGVLIVDADAAFLAEAMQALQAVGASVVVAQTPLAACWALEREDFDAIVCDWEPLVEHVKRQWPGVAPVSRDELPKDLDALHRWARAL